MAYVILLLIICFCAIASAFNPEGRNLIPGFIALLIAAAISVYSVVQIDIYRQMKAPCSQYTVIPGPVYQLKQ